MDFSRKVIDAWRVKEMLETILNLCEDNNIIELCKNYLNNLDTIIYTSYE